MSSDLKIKVRGLSKAFGRKVVLNNPDPNPEHHGANCPERRECKDIGVEGPFLFKREGKYYLTMADYYQGRYSGVGAIADNPYGPYDKRHEAVPCGGGTSFFKDKDGNWWSAFFGNDNQAPWREKPGILRIQFAEDGRIQVARDQPQWVLEKRP